MQQQLAPIWDAIDEEQWQYALQLIEALQKRYRTPNKTLLGLQGLCLAKESRFTEAIAACESIRQQAPKSSDTYQTIHDVLKSSPSEQSSDYLLSTMETGYKAIKSEFMGRLWFMEAVRTGRLLAQRRAAVELQKGFLAREYFYTLVISMYLIYCGTSDVKEKSLQGMLMYRMISKAVANVSNNSETTGTNGTTGPSIENLEEFYLYLDVLRALGKTEESVHALEGFHGQKFASNHDLILLHIEMLREVHGKTSERVHELCQKHLQSGVDDWLVYQAFVDSCASKSEAEKLIVSIASDKPVRNNTLSLVYLHASDTARSDLLHSILGYCRFFCDKLVTFEDLAPYVKLLDRDNATTFLSSLGEIECASEISTVLQDTNIAKFRLLLLPITHTADTLSSSRAELIKFLLSKYTATLALGHDLKETDNQYGDDLLLLAVYTILEADDASPQAQSQAILLLEYALGQSRHNFQIKLHLIRLYRTLGAWSQARKHFVSLNAKQMQHDTLSYLLMEDSVCEYLSTMQITTLRESQKIYHSNKIETPDMICQAYEHGAYSKIAEFLKFQERLSHSIWQIESNLNISGVQILLDKYDWSSNISIEVFEHQIYDNKSRYVLFDLHAAANPPLKQSNHASDQDLIKVKTLTRKLQMMQAVVKNNKSLVTMEEIANEKASYRLVELLYAAKFSSSRESEIAEFCDALRVPAISPVSYDAKVLNQLGELVEIVKYYAVLRLHISLPKRIDQRISAVSSELRGSIESLRRELLTRTSVPDLPSGDVAIGGIKTLGGSVVKGLRAAQSEGLTCLLGVLKSIKL